VQLKRCQSMSETRAGLSWMGLHAGNCQQGASDVFLIETVTRCAELVVVAREAHAEPGSRGACRPGSRFR